MQTVLSFTALWYSSHYFPATANEPEVSHIHRKQLTSVLKNNVDRFAHSFNWFLFRVTLSSTVLIFKSFYCIVLEKIKGKMTPNIKVHSSTCTMSHLSNTHKKLSFTFAHSFNWYLFRMTLAITVSVFKPFYCIVLEKSKGIFTPHLAWPQP